MASRARSSSRLSRSRVDIPRRTCGRAATPKLTPPPYDREPRRSLTWIQQAAGDRSGADAVARGLLNPPQSGGALTTPVLK
ncbi:hypothetical protein GCM10010413_19710 [Promicromonospora sukumoe]